MRGQALRFHEGQALGLLIAVAAGLAVLRHLTPSTADWSTGGLGLGLALAGYASTRLVLSTGGDRRERLAVVWAAAARGVAPGLVAVCAVVLIGALLFLPPADLADQARTVLWTALGLSGADLIRHGAYDPGLSEELLLHAWIVGVAGWLFLGWTLFLVLADPGRRRTLVLGVALAVLAASFVLDTGLRLTGREQQALLLLPPQAWRFLAGAVAGLVLHGRPAFPARTASLALGVYLWAWPLALAPRLVLARPLSAFELAAVLVGALLLAWLTQRAGARLAGPRPRTILAGTAAALAVLAGAGAAILALDGLPERAPAAVRAETALARDPPPLQAACHGDRLARPPPATACVSPPGAQSDVVLWGNSHADQLSPAVLAWAAPRGWGVRQATRSGCLPVLEGGRGLADPGCVAFNSAAVAEWARDRPRLVLVGAGWTLVLDRARGDPDARLDRLEENLVGAVRALRAAVGPETVIVLIGTSPDYGFDPAACHARRVFLGLDPARCDRAVPANGALAARVDARLAGIAAREPGVVLFRPWPALCQDEGCRTRGADGPWQADARHLNRRGGLALSKALSATLDAAVPAG